MKKSQLIKYLVQAWCKNSKNYNEWKLRFVNHDSIESKINHSWNKSFIEYQYQAYTNGAKNIEEIITLLVNI